MLRTIKLKEIKQDSKKWKAIPYSWVGRINIIKMAILPKPIYRFSAISIKVPMTFFIELKQTIQKFICNHKRPRIAKVILRNKNQATEQGWGKKCNVYNLIPLLYSGGKKQCWKNRLSTCRRMELNSYITSYIKINSKWIVDFKKTHNYKTARRKHRRKLS